MQILGVRIDNVTMEETLEIIRVFLGDGKQHYIVTPNPDFLVKAQEDKEFREILNKADLSVPDGFGLIFASRFLGERLKGRVVGVELTEKIKNQKLKIKNTNQNAKIFLLGGFGGVAEKIAAQWPEVVGFSEEIGGEVLFTQIRQCQPNLLLVALGAPKQEKWITQNLAKLPSVKVAIGVGSTFDILSGQTKRAPKIFQALGLEWLWRMFLEPGRWRKVWRSTIIFPCLIIKSLFINT